MNKISKLKMAATALVALSNIDVVSATISSGLKVVDLAPTYRNLLIDEGVLISTKSKNVFKVNTQRINKILSLKTESAEMSHSEELVELVNYLKLQVGNKTQIKKVTTEFIVIGTQDDW